MIFWCYEKCSTCKKAQKKLDECHIAYEWRSIVSNPPSKEELLTFLKLQKEPRKLFNTSGKKYREYGLKDKLSQMSLEEMADLLAGDGMLIKRPFIMGRPAAVGWISGNSLCQFRGPVRSLFQ